MEFQNDPILYLSRRFDVISSYIFVTHGKTLIQDGKLFTRDAVGLVSFAAVFQDVTQRSPKGTEVFQIMIVISRISKIVTVVTITVQEILEVAK